jgi:hypothetical protein
MASDFLATSSAVSSATPSRRRRPAPMQPASQALGPFDVIVAGGGRFGGVFPQHLLTTDVAHRHRILVLEGGPMGVGEHVQNLPMIGLDVPGAPSIAALRGPKPSAEDARPGCPATPARRSSARYASCLDAMRADSTAGRSPGAGRGGRRPTRARESMQVRPRTTTHHVVRVDKHTGLVGS